MPHGELPGAQLPPENEPDPHVHLVHADMHTWSLANPCECEALCRCDEPEDEFEDD